LAISPVTAPLSASIAGRDRSGHLVALVLACGVGALFWGPAARAAHGYFPAPLDDVYIHFDFARALGQGHPFEWIPGQGYSSGETSPLYAVLLAVGWALGFRGHLLGVWAAVVAVLGVASLLRSIRELVRPCPAWLGWLIALVPLSIGVVDWALFSGMEVAAFVAVLGRALVALARTRAARAFPSRDVAQWHLGAWGAALVLLRPEAAVIVAVFAVVAARGAGSRSGLAAVVRASLPGAVATLAVLGANLLATGDARSAGAQLKLLSSNPYLSDDERARVFVENLVTFWMKVVRGELAIVPALVFVMPGLSVVALLRRPHRAVASACLVSALGWMLLVSWNGNAPHHNFRYYVPALVLVAIAAALGVASVVGTASVKRHVAGGLLTVCVLSIAASKIAGQVRHFRSAAANIRDQQIEVGERVARLPANAKILLGDAGAIPYVSGRAAIDALGLGGYGGLPFARAAVHGEAATVELIERLPPSERPTHFALYPNWFSSLTSRFGVEIDRVTIENNVICGGPTKAIYRADWSALDADGGKARSVEVIDELDVGDVISEGEHAYAPPLPHGGWSTLDVLSDSSGRRRFDGGRTIPIGTTETFTAKNGTHGPALLRLRIDASARAITVRVGSTTRDLVLEPARGGEWRTATATLPPIDAGDAITLEARDGEYRDYHVWIERTPRAVR
jgi:hypothetical protein